MLPKKTDKLIAELRPRKREWLETITSLREMVLSNVALIAETPAPTFAEKDRARLIFDRFLAAGLPDPSIDDMDNVIGAVPGTGQGGRILVFTHMDHQFPASVDQFLSTLSEVAPDYVVETVRAPLQQIVTSRGGAGAIFGVGVVLMIWAASGYVGAFGWSANQVGGVRERRPYVGRLLLRMGVALLVAVVLMLALAAAALTEAAADWLGRQLGSLGGTLDVWSTVRWPLFFLTATLLIGILFSVGPYHERFRLREVAPGVLLGVALWGLASWGFGLYLRLFAHYSYIYGTIATVVVFLLWLWLFNLALLYGVAVNAEIRDWRTGRVRGGRTGPEGSAAPRWPGSVAPVPLLEPSADEPPIVGRDDDSASRPVD